MTNINVPMSTPDGDMPKRCDLLADCTCSDPRVESMAALMAGGMGQRDASLRVYSDEWTQRSVEIHARFHAWFPDLRGCCEVTS